MIGNCTHAALIGRCRLHCRRNASNTLSGDLITPSSFQHCLLPRLSRRAQRSTAAAGKINCNAFRTTDVAVDTEPAKRVSEATSHKPKVTIVAVVPADQQHSLGAPWLEVIAHVAERLSWEDPNFQVQVFTDEAVQNSQTQSQYAAAAQKAQILLLFDINSDPILKVLLDSMSTVPTAIALDSHPQLEAATKLNNVTLTKPWEKAAASLPWGSSAKSSKVLQSVRDVYKRKTSDDLLFMLLVLIDAYITEVMRQPLPTLNPDDMQSRCIILHFDQCLRCNSSTRHTGRQAMHTQTGRTVLRQTDKHASRNRK